MPKLTAIVAAVILERPLCLKCLGERSCATRAQIATALQTIDGTQESAG